MEGDGSSNITLMCSSHANPPVERYLWFKINEHNDSMAVGQQQVLLSREGGQYLCTAHNKHGSQNSSIVTLRTKGELQNITMSRVRFYKDHEMLNSH